MNETSKLARSPRLSPREKSALSPRSLKFAIAAYCYHDCFGEEEPNSHRTKKDIRDCQNTECCLWKNRPFQTITGGNVKTPDTPREMTPRLTPEKARYRRVNNR